MSFFTTSQAWQLDPRRVFFGKGKSCHMLSYWFWHVPYRLSNFLKKHWSKAQPGFEEPWVCLSWDPLRLLLLLWRSQSVQQLAAEFPSPCAYWLRRGKQTNEPTSMHMYLHTYILWYGHVGEQLSAQLECHHGIWYSVCSMRKHIPSVYIRFLRKAGASKKKYFYIYIYLFAKYVCIYIYYTGKSMGK